MQLKKFRYPVLLTIISATLLLLSIPAGAVFGSEIDWLSQHVSIAEHFRQTFYENHSLLISFSELGGGSNFYMFAYYGYLCLLYTSFDSALSALQDAPHSPVFPSAPGFSVPDGLLFPCCYPCLLYTSSWTRK